jgi:hypothetical protein
MGSPVVESPESELLEASELLLPDEPPVLPPLLLPLAPLVPAVVESSSGPTVDPAPVLPGSGPPDEPESLCVTSPGGGVQPSESASAATIECAIEARIGLASSPILTRAG